MSNETLLTTVVIVGAILGSVYFLYTKITQELKNNQENKILMEWLKNMQGSVEKSSETTETRIREQTQKLEQELAAQRLAAQKQNEELWKRLEHSSQIIQEVQKHLGGISEFGKDMKDLSNVLKSPKLRGGLGEQFLYEILQNSLPAELFSTQYKFKDGSIADAVIKTDKGLIPIDSKFPMENFKAMLTMETQEERDRVKKVFIRDVKARIEEISSKYILPEENTTDFAVMYIPSENVYYELLVNTPEIEEFARQKNVFMTSPNTLNYQVKAILVAYQQTEMQKHAGEILKALAGIKVEAGRFDEELGTLEKHITHTFKAMETVRSKFGKLFGKIESVEQLGSGEKPKLLE